MSEVPKVLVQIGGDVWDRWERLEVTMSLDEIAPSFTLETQDERDDPEEIFPYGEEDPVQIDVLLPGTPHPERVLTGYIKRPELRDDPDQGLRITVTGHSNTVDLVECHVDPPRRWSDTPALKIARDIAEPFGITVGTGVDLAPNMKRFETNPGESAAQAIQRIAEARGALLQSDSFGNLVFFRSTSNVSGTVLERGQNIIRGTYAGDYSDRFSRYTVYSQRTPRSGHSGAVASGRAVQVVDNAVRRFRPFAEVGDTDEDRAELEQRVKHLANVRAGRSRTYTCEILGWARGPVGGRVLWRPNVIAEIRHRQVQTEGRLLCTRVVLQADARAGFRSQLDFVMPEAYTPTRLPRRLPVDPAPGTRPRELWLGGPWG